MVRKVIFLDRDGVINRCAPPHQYIRTWEEFEFLPHAAEAICLFCEKGYTVTVISSQRGVAQGLLTADALDELHRRMCAALALEGAYIHSIYVCPHENNTCRCRKPKIGLFLRAEQDVPVDKGRSWMIGDSECDILAGMRYGVHTALIGQGAYGQTIRCNSLWEAAAIITGGGI
ncbi:MAG: HAD-IIIA family hydrolase [Eubacteriales bacterium]|nr:HAD-IIIA family hydrolase [Eubacteriales bacterium]